MYRYAAVVRAGRSPYFIKYGRSRLYHADFLEAGLYKLNAVC